MRYDSYDHFLRLVDAVEEAGGAHLPDTCQPSRVPDLDRDKLKNVPGDVNLPQNEAMTCGCDLETLLVVPYEIEGAVEVPGRDDDVEVVVPLRTEKEVETALGNGAGFTTVCAVDDNVAMWPRFAVKGDA